MFPITMRENGDTDGTDNTETTDPKIMVLNVFKKILRIVWNYFWTNTKMKMVLSVQSVVSVSSVLLFPLFPNPRALRNPCDPREVQPQTGPFLILNAYSKHFRWSVLSVWSAVKSSVALFEGSDYFGADSQGSGFAVTLGYTLSPTSWALPSKTSKT